MTGEESGSMRQTTEKQPVIPLASYVQDLRYRYQLPLIKWTKERTWYHSANTIKLSP